MLLKTLSKSPESTTTPLQTPDVSEISIEEFSVTPDTIHQGNEAFLKWHVKHAVHIIVQPVAALPTSLEKPFGLQLENSGSIKISPEQTTQYELIATDEKGNRRRQELTLTVQGPPPPKPEIIRFKILPSMVVKNKTSHIQLIWVTKDAETLMIEPEIGAVKASGEINHKAPQNDTTYTLKASNPQGSVSMTQTVTVTMLLPPPPEIRMFSITPQTVIQGQSELLSFSWSTQNADIIEMDPPIGHVEDTVYQLKVEPPKETTTYTLTVKNAADKEVKRQQSVTVLSHPLTPEMTSVPKGILTMGSSEGTSHEQPEHEIYLDAFLIDRTEVTVAAYRKCVEADVCSSPASGGACNWGQSERQNHPINCVTWLQAETYCHWKGKRLPSEAQWEYAARSGANLKFPWGNDPPDPTRASYKGSEDGFEETSPAGNFSAGASQFDVLDMAGNVWEWVSDWYDAAFYQTSLSSNPTGPETGEFRVVRGGSWQTPAHELYSAARFSARPSTSSDIIGFRCLRLP